VLVRLGPISQPSWFQTSFQSLQTTISPSTQAPLLVAIHNYIVARRCIFLPDPHNRPFIDKSQCPPPSKPGKTSSTAALQRASTLKHSPPTSASSLLNTHCLLIEYATYSLDLRNLMTRPQTLELSATYNVCCRRSWWGFLQY